MKSWLLFYFVVLILLIGAISSNRLYESHISMAGREATTASAPVPYTAVTPIYVWHQPLSEMPVGAQGCYEVYYTSNGEPFVWSWEDSNPICKVVVRHDKDGWHAKQQGPPNHEQITGYVSVAQADGIPIS